MGGGAGSKPPRFRVVGAPEVSRGFLSVSPLGRGGGHVLLPVRGPKGAPPGGARPQLLRFFTPPPRQQRGVISSDTGGGGRRATQGSAGPSDGPTALPQRGPPATAHPPHLRSSRTELQSTLRRKMAAAVPDALLLFAGLPSRPSECLRSRRQEEKGSRSGGRARTLPPPCRPLCHAHTLFVTSLPASQVAASHERVKPYVSATFKKKKHRENTVTLFVAEQDKKRHCSNRRRNPCPWRAANARGRSTFGFERAGVSTKEDQFSQRGLVIEEDGQTGVAAERAGILDPATHKFEQTHMSRRRKTRQLRQHYS
ncbi:hypothetical protein NDU88_001292 [Pleurodeles waltl]|uniref:Uncharacterized protein n=1 Tax=Pleurodeles waltl TaxID=8319 RepID=A0AAV7R9U4_PLEWA|nr:hypothetical protein NDU88_001292 [Pleurodeles waltl]